MPPPRWIVVAAGWERWARCTRPRRRSTRRSQATSPADHDSLWALDSEAAEAVAGEEFAEGRETARSASSAEAQFEVAAAADCVPDSHNGHSHRPSRTVVHSLSFRRRARSRHAVARTPGAPPERAEAMRWDDEECSSFLSYSRSILCLLLRQNQTEEDKLSLKNLLHLLHASLLFPCSVSLEPPTLKHLVLVK